MPTLQEKRWDEVRALQALVESKQGAVRKAETKEDLENAGYALQVACDRLKTAGSKSLVGE